MNTERNKSELVKILSPVTSLKAAAGVISAGADEIYCGVIIPDLRYLGLSTRYPSCSLSSYNDLGKVVEYAHDHGVNTIVTTEFPFMAVVIEKSIKEHISRCVEMGVDALIATDLGTILMIQDMSIDIPVYASTYLASMNYEAVDFLKGLGIKRLILEHHMTLDEIQEIVKRNKGLEIELFIHGPGCSNINVNCYGCPSVTRISAKTLRNKELTNTTPIPSTTCRATYRVSKVNASEKGETWNVPILDAFTFCSFCLLPDLIKTGVTGFKIVGRELSPIYQEEVTRAYRELIDLIEKGQMEAFREKLEFYKHVEACYLPSLDACHEKRCYYSPLFHAPYKLQTSFKTS